MIGSPQRYWRSSRISEKLIRLLLVYSVCLSYLPLSSAPPLPCLWLVRWVAGGWISILVESMDRPNNGRVNIE